MTACYRFLVAIETDATRYHGEGARRPRLLARSDTDQLLAHLGADLQSLLPDLEHCWLAAAGSLLDQTQLLRPGYPAFSALERAASDPLQARPGGRTGISARDDRIEPAALHPEPGIPLGVLQLLPVIACGPARIVTELGATMEHRFLEQGQVSAHSARWLESAFRIALRHARYMTLTDLLAMFRLQLEHFGYLPLWMLIDAALSDRNEPLEVRSSLGQVYRWQDRAVSTEFQTLDYWAQSGLGCREESARGQLAGGYADWTRELRQYLATLSAHAIALRFHLPGQPGQPLPGTYFAEAVPKPPPPHSAAVTEHSFSSLGTVCITTVHDGCQSNFYPLAPAGLNDIHRALRAAGTGTIAYPGTLLYDPASRTLVPDRDEPPARNAPT